jgi:hypothetical protein
MAGAAPSWYAASESLDDDPAAETAARARRAAAVPNAVLYDRWFASLDANKDGRVMGTDAMT